MAARKLGLSSVPVYVLPVTAADTAAETIDRIVHQIVTNDHIVRCARVASSR